jgi:sec-independent protein translocase protein TatC
MTDAQGRTGEMPFLDHLEELRFRLLWSLGALVVATIAWFAFVSQYDVIGILAEPIQPYLPGGKLIFTNPADAFTIVMKSAFVLGLMTAAPVIAYHIWMFLAPALHPHEKRVVVPILLGATGLFAAGVYLAVRWVLPAMFGFLLTFQSASLEPMISATGYFSFAVSLALASGGTFQLPILILALTMLGLVTPTTLAKYRRHAMVGSLVAAAVITPGDVLLVTAMLGVPLYGLYEISIVLSWIVYRRKAKKLREREMAETIGGGLA